MFLFSGRDAAEGLPQYGNIMYDRRVVRGNTYALHTLPAVSFILNLNHKCVVLCCQRHNNVICHFVIL